MSVLRTPVPLLVRQSQGFKPPNRLASGARYVHSALMNLSGLSSSRESQHFSKERRLPRIEYSSQLQLIRSSEVDPFDAPGSSPLAPGRSPPMTADGVAMTAPALSLVAFQSILKELDGKKQEVHLLNKALDQLSARYSARNRDARNLSWIVLVLAFGFVFPGWLREPTERLVTWVNELVGSSVASMPQALPAPAPPQNLRREIIGVRSRSRESVRVNPTPLIPVEHLSAPRSWSRFFWASPT